MDQVEIYPTQNSMSFIGDLLQKASSYKLKESTVKCAHPAFTVQVDYMLALTAQSMLGCGRWSVHLWSLKGAIFLQ